MYAKTFRRVTIILQNLLGQSIGRIERKIRTDVQ